MLVVCIDPTGPLIKNKKYKMYYSHVQDFHEMVYIFDLKGNKISSNSYAKDGSWMAKRFKIISSSTPLIGI